MAPSSRTVVCAIRSTAAPVGHVHREAERAPPAGLDGPHRFGQLRFAHVGERDIRAVPRHPFRNGPPDPPRPARDEHHLSVKIH